MRRVLSFSSMTMAITVPVVMSCISLSSCSAPMAMIVSLVFGMVMGCISIYYILSSMVAMLPMSFSM